ncbi:XRE family transcriptional regulator [Streptomyces ipomoeae]|uniref:Toxin-antitoxin system, antitoxin component, Xre family n=2 Tax=Streptomyces ipomoeae TaxID=103232 RepID=L1KWQ3_9ACTN|nr:helix-turn-helix transcriptional regulator [Streptomyces ipomoeae]EKX65052.1 toxin-antitoxin system, antitoxin component, Xre family [Streptomyces ipomoeae 91-03]MDX2696383.1 helix-turn-helix transcriptional regulator [Streptomyces ipomoeae]MDX2825662.1 helix-turn-helix transcriptional regulator [Streptomyces ipomoeae]MDX2841906.1 helix-turn-helix transcriptional regulator [Streptomyces ipomoeae]MDX2878296.1 helix-turn-helix transcriptional regulator [Streptomyces ipomoeae]
MSELVDGQPDSGRAALGRTLRFLREKADKTLAQLAAETSYDKSYLYRLESGERLSKRAVMEDLDTYYGSGDLLVRLWEDARKEVIKDKYKAFMELEATARVMWMFQLRVPGLLQTEGYARTVLSGLSGAQTTTGNSEEIEEQVAARMARQELLYRDPAPSVRVILDEGAVRRAVPDKKVWADQLSHLVEASESPSIVIQVLPYAAGQHDLMDGHLWLFWQRGGDAIAYSEGNGIGELIEDPERVLAFRLAYDRVRDAALTPVESTAFIKRLLEECRP